MSDSTHYDVIGVDPEASRDEIRAAYRSRVDELKTARERKGVSDSALQANREQVARLHSAWNVLSDPFQRKRYDSQLGGSGSGDDELDDDGVSTGEATSTAVEPARPRGLRGLLTPPPPRNGDTATTKRPPAGRRPPPQPTITLPPGMRFAEPKPRGLALLFDLMVLIILVNGSGYLVPRLVRSDYGKISDQITKLTDKRDHQNSLADTADSNKSSYTDKANAAKKKGDTEAEATDREKASAAAANAKAHRAEANADQKKIDADNNKIQTGQYLAGLVGIVLALVYLVPSTALTGQTLGKRFRKLKVVRVDGSPVGWSASFVRFALPVVLAVAVPSIGPVVGLGLVIWSLRDPNHQGVHDKLAKTIVVEA
jgi:hypothetical protein